MKKLILCLAIFASISQNHGKVEASALREGEFSVMAYGGIAPSMFVNRKNSSYILNNVTTPGGSSVSGLRFSAKAPNFSKTFEFPFIFGGSIGYNATDQLEIFANVDYTIADSGKNKVTLSSNQNSVTRESSKLKQKVGTFGALGAYLGARYYFDCGGKWYPFVGAKMGVLARKHSKGTTYVDTVRYVRGKYFESNAAFAGAPQLGLDFEIAEYFDFILMAEAVGSTKMKHNKNRLPFFNRVGGMFTFPVVAGIRFRAY